MRSRAKRPGELQAYRGFTRRFGVALTLDQGQRGTGTSLGQGMNSIKAAGARAIHSPLKAIQRKVAAIAHFAKYHHHSLRQL